MQAADGPGPGVMIGTEREVMQRIGLYGGTLFCILIIACATTVAAVPVGPPPGPVGPGIPGAQGMAEIIKPGTVLTYEAMLSSITTDRYGVSSQSLVASFDWVIRVEEASEGYYAGTAEIVPHSGTVTGQVYRWSYTEGQQNPDWYGPPLWIDPAAPVESAATYGRGTWELLGHSPGTTVPFPGSPEQVVNQMQTTDPGTQRFMVYDVDYGVVRMYSEKTSDSFMSFWLRSTDEGLTGPFGGLVP